jgi:hypothetical protein
MKKTHALTVAMTLALGLSASVRALAQDQTTHKLTKLWETEATLKVPESVRFDAKRKVLYVSNIDGPALGSRWQGFDRQGRASMARSSPPNG